MSVREEGSASATRVHRMTRQLADEINFGIHPCLDHKGMPPSLWLNNCRRKILENRHRRQLIAQVSFPLMINLTAAFERVDASPEQRRIALLGWLRQLDVLLQAHGVHSEMPTVLGRMFFDICNGKVDAIFRSSRSGPSHTLDLYEFQKRAVLSSMLVKASRACTKKEADQWVWERIKPLPVGLRVKKEGPGVIENWRRSLRRLRQQDNLQSHWAESKLESDYPLQASAATVGKVSPWRNKRHPNSFGG